MNKDEVGNLISQALPSAKYMALKILNKHPDDVEDVLQEASLKAWRMYRNFRGDSLFSTWFMKIVIRQALMQLRKYRSKERLLTASVEEFDGFHAKHFRNPEVVVSYLEKKRHIAEGFLQLTKARRIEISKALFGEPIDSNKAKSTRLRARRSLKEILAA